jgi:hypothetical protein
LRTHVKLRFMVLLLAVIASCVVMLPAQEGFRALPEVTEHGSVVYPPLARQARIQGQVVLRFTTNGHTVIQVAIVKGHPLLVHAAQDCLQSWKFADHVPGTFEVTFNFRLTADGLRFLEQPGLVEAFRDSESAIDSYTLPEHWKVRIRNPQGLIDTALTLWTYHDVESEVDGYETGPQGQERPINNAHVDGDLLGFDATVDDQYGQRLKFSMIGKKSGESIKGVFLNYWGGRGTWSATRNDDGATTKAPTEPSSSDEAPITSADIAYHGPIVYSRLVNGASIKGVVRLRATTNGSYVTGITPESGDPFLLHDAAANLRTWRFTDGKFRTFEVTYKFEATNSYDEFLKQPGVVDVYETPPQLNGIFSTFAVPWETWRAQLVNSRGRMSATLSLKAKPPDDEPDAFFGSDFDGRILGSGNNWEPIFNGHQDGDMLGFDATVTGPMGKPLRVSLLGKRTGNKITGVFLDYSGTPGTWTALRQPADPKPSP